MEHILFDFYNDTRMAWLLRFCEYFNLSFEDAQNYFNNTDISTIGVDEVVQYLNINLNKSNSFNVKIMCRHMTTANNEGLESFKKHGLLDLKKMLQLDTPLSEFLAKYEIAVDVDNKVISIGNKRYPILSYNDTCTYCLNGERTEMCTGFYKCKLKKNLESLSRKLYKLGATVEFFIRASLNDMERYSTIDKYPEILFTIGSICSCIPDNKMTELSLGIEWSNERKKCYIMEFPVILADMETYVPIDYDDNYDTYSGPLTVNGYDYSDYLEKQIPQNVFNNIFLIKWFINAYFFDNEKYGSLLPDKCVAPDDITIIEVNNKKLIYV